MTETRPLPLVLLPACTKTVDGMSFHAVGDKYVRAVAEAAEAQPLLLPNLAELIDPRAILDQVDGLLMTGSPSNVHPRHYGRPDLEELSVPHDEPRDAVTLGLIHGALERGLPLLCICRGFQELNVALGGTLYPRLHEVPGRLDHRSPATGDMAVDYAPRHALAVEGWFEETFGAPEIQVNSLHHQGIETLAPRLVAEGRAPDGTVEAVRVTDAEGFAVGVQWHPEYRVLENPDSVALFAAFGRAVAARQRARRTKAPA